MNNYSVTGAPYTRQACKRTDDCEEASEVIIKKKTVRFISIFLVLTLAFSLYGCDIMESLVKETQNFIEPIIDTNINGIYTNSVSQECLAFDPDIPDIAFSGEFNQTTGEFTASEIYACRLDGSILELYNADPPHFAADFSRCSYQLEASEGFLSAPGKPDAFVKWDGEYRISYNDSLALFNDELSFKFRSRFFPVAYAVRDEPAPQTDFVPQRMEEDVGKPIENTIVKEANYYARSTLSKNERAFYDAAYDAVFHMKGKISVQKYKLTIEQVSDIIRFIFDDAPELFWCPGGKFTYTYKKDIIQTIQFEYNFSSEDVKALQKKIDSEAAAILKSIDATMSEYQKFIQIYTELGKRIEYDWAAYEANTAGKNSVDNADQTIVGGLYKHKAVCGGIARSLQYLLHMVGIECYFVTGTKYSQTGTIPPGNHGWNMIKIEEQWYYADLSQDMGTIKAQDIHDYLMTDQECALLRTFTMQDVNGKTYENPPLPKCGSHRFDIYVRNPVYFKTFDDNAVERLKSLLFKALQEGQGYFKVCFENKQDAAKAAEMFTTQGNSIAGDIPVFSGIAICQIYTTVNDSGNIVIILPGYRCVPVATPVRTEEITHPSATN